MTRRTRSSQGVELYKYPPRTAASGSLAYFGEYARSFAMTAWLLAVRARRRGWFDAIQTCNPPDIFWPLGISSRAISGARFVFDQHDLCPELFESRFPDGSRKLGYALRFLERRTYRAADHVIATNESYARVAGQRGAATTKTSRSSAPVRPPTGCAEASRIPRARGVDGSSPPTSASWDHRTVWTTSCEPPTTSSTGSTAIDVAFVLMGSGDCFDELVALRDELGLEDFVTFTGRVPDDVVTSVLSTADIGLSPDPKNPLNDVSTMNKTLEYMAYRLPVVAFDLLETRVSAADAAVYATPNRIDCYAQAIVDLLDDEPRRRRDGHGSAGSGSSTSCRGITSATDTSRSTTGCSGSNDTRLPALTNSAAD